MSFWSRIVGKRSAEPLTLVLYTRAQCPLCDGMKAEIARAKLGGRCALLEVDVDMDPILVERHGRSVPVLEIEGRVAFKGSLTAEDLERKIARALHDRGQASGTKPAMPKLYVLSGPDIGKTFDVVEGAKIGRGVQCAVHLRDVSVSREHAKIEREDNVWRVVDTGSRNGLSVGGSKVPSVILRDGEEFQVGEILLRFRGEAVPAAPAARAMPVLPAREVVAPDEIVLEEDLPSAPMPPPRPAAPERPARVASELEQTVLTKPRPSAPVQRGAGILQYKKIENRSGLFASDLAQQPLWIRLGAGLIALALFAAIFLFAFKGTSFLKGQAAGGADGIEDESER